MTARSAYRFARFFFSMKTCASTGDVQSAHVNCFVYSL
jgi:hypothetical protein